MFEDYEEYYEQTPADEIFLEAREKLIRSLKESVKYHVDSVLKENEKLKQENSNLQKLVKGINQKERELEGEKLKYKNDLRNAKLSELMLDLQAIVYFIDYDSKSGEKCDKCDDSRNISYTTPSGRINYEQCACADRYKEYKTIEKILHEFRYGNNKMLMWFKRYNTNNDNDGYSSGSVIEIFYDNYEHCDIPSYGVHFRDKEKAEAYVEYLNKI